MNKPLIGKKIECLDSDSFVRLVDYMGDDAAIVQAARVSYGDGTKSIREDAGLINYLLQNEHTTPFEMVEFKFHCKMPIFVARQWIRHRTASVNEYSARYSILKDEFHLPETFRAQAKGRGAKQIAEGDIDPAVESALLSEYDGLYKTAYTLYKKAIDLGVGREMARICIPVAVTTEWYWKINLHNLFRFMKLRLDAHAQLEIRVFAEAMAGIVKQIVPAAWDAFEEHIFHAVKLSRSEAAAILAWTTSFDLSRQNELVTDEATYNLGVDVFNRICDAAKAAEEST